MPSGLFDVKDRIVVITGGMGQLGRQFTLALADRGAKVAVFDVAVEQKKIADRYGDRAADERIAFFDVDITGRPGIEKALAAVVEKWGVPHGLINNAALDSPPDAPASENGPFETYPEASFDRVMKVNVKGTFLCCQVIGGAMAREGRGSVVNISSIYGMVSPDQRIYEYRRKDGETFFKPVAYAVSKSAIYNLTRYLATYWAPKGVRINTLTFAGVFNNQGEEFLKEYCPRVPLGRMAREDEYNGAVVFLVSDASSYMTGANVVLDGGWTAW
ncbi:MAG: SDR family oxidoreductase [Deltaproteobacteria bacterium]|nr:SDR family oxidoreductase [Deltaproteobacteria bacterium]